MYSTLDYEQLNSQNQLKQQQDQMYSPQPQLQQPLLYHTGSAMPSLQQSDHQLLIQQQAAGMAMGSGFPGMSADASSACRSVYVGNVHVSVTESMLAQIFSNVGPLQGCKLIRKEKSSFGFVDFLEHSSAAAAILSLNGKILYGQSLKVNWAYANNSNAQKDDAAGSFQIFVGDLSPDVSDLVLRSAFAAYPSSTDARVMWDVNTGRSRGFGFVTFRNQADAERAMAEMSGRWLGNRAIRCNWATKTTSAMAGGGGGGGGGGGSEPGPPGSSGSNVSGVLLPPPPSTLPPPPPPPHAMQEALASMDGRGTQDTSASSDYHLSHTAAAAPAAAEPQPQYTTVYVGNLAHEVTEVELHRLFYMLGVGTIEEVRVQKDKGFGFVRYKSQEEAAVAIQAGNGCVIGGKAIKCSWGSKPTIPSSMKPVHSLVPQAVHPFETLPALTVHSGFSPELMGYQRQMTGANTPVLPVSAPLHTQSGAGANRRAVFPAGPQSEIGNSSITSTLYGQPSGATPSQQHYF